MTKVQLQNGDPLNLQDGIGVIDLEGGGNPVQPPVVKIEPGDLGAAGYPSFFPCATWEYTQAITGHLGRTPFTSGWVRQRRSWRENNSSVNLTFEMPTNMFDRWSTWMVNNGYEWFTMYLDRVAGEQVLTEVRLVSTIDYIYREFDTVIATVTGELGAGALDYGPQSGPLEGVSDFNDFCVPVYLTNSLGDYDNASSGVVIPYVLAVGADSTTPVEIRWYEDGVAIPGATGPTLQYTVPVVDDPKEGGEFTIAANVANPCGYLWEESKVTVPPDTACLPYDCAALITAMASAEGTGVWDLLDGNDEPVIPALWDQQGVYLAGVGLKTDATGSPWGSSTGISRETLRAGVDLDLCEGPYIARNGFNNSGNQNEFSLEPTQKWGSALPNVAMAVVAYGLDAHGTDPDNFLFRGITGLRVYTATGSTTVVNVPMHLQGGRINIDSTDYDAIWFNYAQSPSGSRWAMTLPFGTLTSSNPKLIEATISIASVEYPASNNQSYPTASYDMMVTADYFARITDGVTGNTYSDSRSVTYKMASTFETHDNPALPIRDSRKAYFTDALSVCYYLAGGFDGIYNLAIRHVHGNEGAGTPITGGANPGAISSDLVTSFLRNYSDYETPAYCEES